MRPVTPTTEAPRVNPCNGEPIYYLCSHQGVREICGLGLKNAVQFKLYLNARNGEFWLEDADGFVVPAQVQVEALRH